MPFGGLLPYPPVAGAASRTVPTLALPPAAAPTPLSPDIEALIAQTGREEEERAAERSTSIARAQSAGPQMTPAALPSPVERRRVMPPWMMALALMAAGVRGGRAGLTGAASGLLNAQREADLRQRQDALDAARVAQEQERRSAAIGRELVNTQREARKLRTREEFDQYVVEADRIFSERLGTRPGVVIGNIKFEPPSLRERAREHLDMLRKRTSRDGLLPWKDVERSVVEFDVNNDGRLEKVPVRRLIELAGEAFFNPQTGEREDIIAAQTKTYGEIFGSARGTVLENERIPSDKRGDPDYGEALTVLRRNQLLERGGGSLRDAQTRLRAELFEAATMPGVTDDHLRDRFAGRLTSVGLSFRRELANVRQGLSTDSREAARQAVFATLLRRGINKDTIRALKERLSAYGLDFDAELALARQRLIAEGRRYLTEDEKYDPRNLQPDALLERGRRALLDANASALAAEPDEPSPAETPSPTTRPTSERQRLRTRARQELETARRAQGDPRPVSDQDVDHVLADPENVRKLKQAIGGRQ